MVFDICIKQNGEVNLEKLKRSVMKEIKLNDKLATMNSRITYIKGSETPDDYSVKDAKNMIAFLMGDDILPTTAAVVLFTNATQSKFQC